MKRTAKQLLALLLALTMSLSLLSAPVWAADVSGEAAESTAVTQSEPEDESAPEESAQADASPEEVPEDVPDASPEVSSEAEPEAEPEPQDVPDASPEVSSEPEPEPEPEPDPEEAPDASPEASSEEEPEPEETVTVQDTHTHDSESFTAWTDELAKSQNGEGKTAVNSLPNTAGNYYLTKNVTLSDTWEVPSGGVKLCLNGHGITKTGTGGSVIQVGNNAKLTLYDCDTTTEHKYTVGSDGVATVNDNATGEGVKTFTGGYLTGGRGTNDANQFFGGAVYVSGSFTMYGGTILGNCGNGGAGGGVFACQGGSFNLYGGAILGNYAYHGGGVSTGSSNSTFAMYGGSVEGNAGATGGGVYVENGGSFNLYGGSVVRNTGTVSGGVHVAEHGTMRLSSAQNAPAIQIVDNTAKEGTPSNLWLELWGGKQPVVTIANDTSYPLMRSDAKVGVTIGSRDNSTDGKGVFTTGGQMTETLRKCFKSDNPAYAIHLTQNGEAEIGDHVHSFTYAANDNTITATCVGEGICPLTSNPELVLFGPTAGELTYDGAEKEASVSGSIPDVDTPAVVYTKESSFTGKPRDAGTYTASLTLGDATATVSFTITPKTVGLDWSDTSFTYNGSAQKPAATATGLVDGDACAVTVTGEQTNAGEYTATASALSNGNYTLPQAPTQSFSIAPKTVGLDWSDTKLTYNGSAQKPAATATGLVDGDACAVTVTGEQTNAGEYTATASALSNGNYTLPQTVTQSFTIQKAKQAAPNPPVVKEVTQTSITVEAVAGQEYSLDGAQSWQSGGTFTGLTPDTAYGVLTRLPGDANHEASAPSKASAARTEPEPEPEPQKKAVRHLGVRVTQTGSKLTVKWSKHTDVDSFEVRAAYCGSHSGKIPTVKVKTKKNKDGSLSIKKLSGKVLKSNRNFRVQIVGKKDGKVVYKSVVCHIVGTKSRWRTNAKDITNLPAKTVTLKLSSKKKKTKQLRPKTVLQHPKRHQLGDDHAPEFRYASSDKGVAKVNKKGKITAKGPGKCTIYVIARNGLEKKVRVTVKK